MFGINFIKNEKGASIVILAITMAVLLGFTAISVDIGIDVTQRIRLSSAVDAAALAGAQELVNHPENAVSVASSYLVKNGVDPADAQIEILDNGNTMNITSTKNFEYTFAKVLGLENGNVSAHSKVKVMPVTEVDSGVKPFAVEKQTLEYGQEYILKDGIYGGLALGGRGASNYKVNIINGFPSSLKVGDSVETEPGNMAGPTISAVETLIDQCVDDPICTYESYNPKCPRILTVVMVDSISVSGRTTVEIVGFAAFFLESVEKDGGDVQITGRFIKIISRGELSDTQTDYGLRGIKIVE